MCHLMIMKVSCLISYGYLFSKELPIILDKIGWMDGWMDKNVNVKVALHKRVCQMHKCKM